MSVFREVRFSAAVVSLRFALAMAVAFLVTLVASSLPVRLFRFDWIFEFATTIRTATPLAILSIGFLLLALSLDIRLVMMSRFLQVAQRLANWVAIGYFLLIPCQAIAGYFELQRVSLRAKSELAAAADVLNRVAAADSPEQLRAVITSVPVLAQQLSAQPSALADFRTARANLLRNGRANLTKVQTAVDQRVDAGLRRFWLLLLQNSVLLGVYGWAFRALSSHLQGI